MGTRSIMLAIVAAALVTIVPFTAHAGDAADGHEVYGVDTTHSDVVFKIRHLVSRVTGTFNEFDAEIALNPDDLEASSVRFTIDAASIDTRNDKRDQHLRSEDFFWVEKHPEITFTSSSIERTGEDTFDVTGTLTMRGTSRQLTLPVTYHGTMASPWGDTRAGFSTSTTLNRKDYGIVWNKTLDAGGVVLGETVDIEIDLQAVREEPASGD